jgi:S-formylglutathione hydrolase FrmB
MAIMPNEESMMRRFRAGITVLLFLFSVGPTLAQSQGDAASPRAPSGTLRVIDVPAPSLAGSWLPMPPAQRTAVYLPPSYDGDARKRYPVVYFLTGFADQIFLYTHVPIYQGFLLQEAMDRLIGEKKIGEMIVVIPNGLTPLGGSFYVNSPVNGNWEDFIVRDLVGHIDASFRTIPAASGRALGGHSMGGFGALNIALRHPDVFAAVYALSPGLAAPGGLETHPSFADTTVRRGVCGFLETINGMERCQSEVMLLAQASYRNQVFDIYPLFAVAYSAAFAPGTGGSGPMLEYPYRREGADFVRDPAVWERCEWGFGKWEEKVQQNLANLKSLSFIAVDVGENDEYPWIPAGCRYVSQLMLKAGIRNELITHPGNHQDQLRERLETSMFPALSRFFAGRG